MGGSAKGRKQKMAARGSAERRGQSLVFAEVVGVYWLVYRARGYVGPDPLPTLSGPGLVDFSSMPVVGR